MSRAARYSMAVATLAFVLFALMPAFETSSQQSKENEITLYKALKQFKSEPEEILWMKIVHCTILISMIY